MRGGTCIELAMALARLADAPSLFEGFGLGDANRPVVLTPIALEDQGQGFFFVRYAVGEDR